MFRYLCIQVSRSTRTFTRTPSAGASSSARLISKARVQPCAFECCLHDGPDKHFLAGIHHARVFIVDEHTHLPSAELDRAIEAILGGPASVVQFPEDYPTPLFVEAFQVWTQCRMLLARLPMPPQALPLRPRALLILQRVLGFTVSSVWATARATANRVSISCTESTAAMFALVAVSSLLQLLRLACVQPTSKVLLPCWSSSMCVHSCERLPVWVQPLICSPGCI